MYDFNSIVWYDEETHEKEKGRQYTKNIRTKRQTLAGMLPRVGAATGCEADCAAASAAAQAAACAAGCATGSAPWSINFP